MSFNVGVTNTVQASAICNVSRAGATVSGAKFEDAETDVGCATVSLTLHRPMTAPLVTKSLAPAGSSDASLPSLCSAPPRLRRDCRPTSLHYTSSSSPPSSLILSKSLSISLNSSIFPLTSSSDSSSLRPHPS